MEKPASISPPPPSRETARSKQSQENIFIHLLELAKNTDLPLITHSRDAAQKTYDILSKFESLKGVIHCFSYSWNWAEKFLDLGFHLSFTGIVTFPNAKNVQETVAKTPLEKMIVETDCPFLAPQPVRGQRNEPKNVIIIAEKIAELKGISFEKVAEVTTKNAGRLFGI